MKKLVLVLVLFALIATGTAFADYPGGLGIGAVAGYSGGWESGSGNNNNWALSLKLPSMPIFWAIDLELRSKYLGVGVRGDHYLFHNALVSNINLDWYLGVGGWVFIGLPDGLDPIISLGARLPIGLSWQPLDILELFIEFAPSLGVQVSPDFHFPAGGWGGAFGIRLWF